jgi:DNA-binding transcriptional LysR family regulator
MLDELRGLVVFAELSESMSFTRAAEHLGMTRSAVSKHIARLEQQLGAQLLTRTTRKLALTEAGERVRPLAAQMARSVELSREAAQCQAGGMVGHLRIAAPSELGRSYLTALLTRFLTQHPQLSVELVLGDAYVDLVAERIDVALRVGRFTDSTLLSRRIANVHPVVCAAPSYLAAHGTPRSPAELRELEWIIHVPNRSQKISFEKGQRTVVVQMSGRLQCNDGGAGVEACVRGFGVLLVPAFEVAQHVRAGRLVQLIPSWSVGHFTLHAVYPATRYVPLKLRAFLDAVVLAWRKPPWQADLEGKGVQGAQPAHETSRSADN